VTLDMPDTLYGSKRYNTLNMGMDLVAIINHNRNAKQLLQLPKLLDESTELRELFMSKHNCEESELKLCEWSGPYEMTANNLGIIWTNLKSQIEFISNIEINHYAEIDTYFGEVSVYEQTINVSPFPEHKYRNLRNLVTSEYIFELNRIIAKILGSNQIVYCCDSYYHPEIIESKSMEGWNINSIIEYSNEKFGEPPIEINAAIENLYFIDSFDLELKDMDPDKEVWSRANYEYEKEQKGEPPYNTV